MNSRGARELCSADVAVMAASELRTSVSPVTDPPRFIAERTAAGLAGYTSTTSLLLTREHHPKWVRHARDHVRPRSKRQPRGTTGGPPEPRGGADAAGSP